MSPSNKSASLLIAVDGEKSELFSLLVDGRHRLQQRHGVELPAGVARAGDLQVQHLAATEAGGMQEGVKGRLLPDTPAGDRRDWSDGVHELGQAGDLYPIGVLQQADQHAADD